MLQYLLFTIRNVRMVGIGHHPLTEFMLGKFSIQGAVHNPCRRLPNAGATSGIFIAHKIFNELFQDLWFRVITENA